MEVDEKLVKQVAQNARLRIGDAQVPALIKDFQEILDLFKVIEEADAGEGDGALHPISLPEVLREDKVGPSLSQEEALSTAEHKKDGYFKGPKAL